MDFFLSKPFELQPVYDKWTDAPLFNGKANQLDAWLIAMEKGCTSRRVPRDLWCEVAQHYMGSRATRRFSEVKKVFCHSYGGEYKWKWNNFRLAMEGITWNTPASQLVDPKWFSMLSKGTEWVRNAGTPGATKAQSSQKQQNKPQSDKALQKMQGGRSNSIFSSFSQPATSSLKKDPGVKKQASLRPQVTATPSSSSKGKIRLPMVTPKHTDKPEELIAKMPLWLVQTCMAFDYEKMSSGHRKTMSIVAAILITAGSIPSLPAVSAGAAGAFLASGAAHVLGSTAVGVGTWIAAQSGSATD